ncbi:MAG TPA: hypothetical protein VK973_04685, partial [Arenicellales bacterium]|nr:hypothetical protein [Arenicellales bacterium]
PAGEPQRFGERFGDVHIPALADAVDALKTTPGVTLFPELKADTLPRHDRPAAISRLMNACGEVLERTVVISFEEEILRFARSHGAPRVGWVVSELGQAAEERARVLQPDFLFVDRAAVMPGRLWDGPWRWAVYEINDAREARRLADQGVWGVETASVQDLAAALAAG